MDEKKCCPECVVIVAVTLLHKAAWYDCQHYNEGLLGWAVDAVERTTYTQHGSHVTIALITSRHCSLYHCVNAVSRIFISQQPGK